MKKQLLNWFCSGVLLLLASGLSAQEPATPPAVPTAGDAAKPEAGTNQVSAFKFKSSKVIASGINMGSFLTIKADSEYIGIHVLGGCRVVSENEGKQILVYLNDTAKNWIKFEFITDDVPEFNADTAYSLVSKYFGNLNAVRSMTTMLGKPSVVFTAKTGTAAVSKEIRAQVIQCKAGLLVVSITAYGANASNAVFTMQRLVSSIQSTAKEKDLLVPKPVPES